MQQFVDSLAEKEVIETTKGNFARMLNRACAHSRQLLPEGFALARQGKLREAIKRLSELKGVGPATATAILSIANFDVPFMADEALEAGMVCYSRAYG